MTGSCDILHAVWLLWCIFQFRMCATHLYQGGVNYTSVSTNIVALFLRATLTRVNAKSCLETTIWHSDSARLTFCVD